MHCNELCLFGSKAFTQTSASGIAAEGMFSSMRSLNEVEVNGFVEDNQEAFTQKAVELYTKAEVWKDKQNNGFKVLNHRFDKSNFKDEFAQKIEDLRTDLKSHRQNNFIGNILQHQTLQSTKYLSKWIEEKNR